MQQAVKWEGRHTVVVEPIGAQRRPKWEGQLTGVSCNSGWGFGAVELYCWWYTERSWGRTHTHTHRTNTYTHARTHIYTPQMRGWGSQVKIQKKEGRRKQVRENRMRGTGRQDGDDRQKWRKNLIGKMTDKTEDQKQNQTNIVIPHDSSVFERNHGENEQTDEIGDDKKKK